MTPPEATLRPWDHLKVNEGRLGFISIEGCITVKRNEAIQQIGYRHLTKELTEKYTAAEIARGSAEAKVASFYVLCLQKTLFKQIENVLGEDYERVYHLILMTGFLHVSLPG